MSAPFLPVLIPLGGPQTSYCPVRRGRTASLSGPTTVDAPPPVNPCVKKLQSPYGPRRREPSRRRAARTLRLRGNLPLPQQVKPTAVDPNHDPFILPQSDGQANLRHKKSGERTTANRCRAHGLCYPSRIASVNHELVVNRRIFRIMSGAPLFSPTPRTPSGPRRRTAHHGPFPLQLDLILEQPQGLGAVAGLFRLLDPPSHRSISFLPTAPLERPERLAGMVE